MQEINNFVISKICKRIKNLSTEDIGLLKNAIEYASLDINDIKKELANIKKKNIKDIEKYLGKIADNNIEFSEIYYKARDLATINTISEHKKLNDLLLSFKKRTKDTYRNISNTLGFKTNGVLKSIRGQYINIVDKAILALQTGTMDYYSALRSSIKEMAKSGVKYVEFDSGYNRRLESQLSMNILEGARQMSMDMQNIMAKEYGADGYEITAHALCAPDHQSIQGVQFSKKDYENMNAGLSRQIGTLNCKHMAIPIILGVSQPTYSNNELKEITDLSNKKVSYNDKTYTRYEASQYQRFLELKIRRQKEVVNALEYAGDSLGAKESKKKLKDLTYLYKDFSRSVGLSIYSERLII